MRFSLSLTFLVAGMFLPQTLSAAQFSFATKAYAAVDSPQGLGTADLNGDGLLDMVVTSHTPDRLEWWLNDAGGGFRFAGSLLLPPSSDPRKVALADLDGDGQCDAGILLVGTNQLQLAMGQADGSFVLGSSFATGLFPIAIAAADADGDGDADLLVVTQDDNTATLFFNDGAGILTGLGFAVGNAPFGVTFGDFDGDADLDFAVSNRVDQTVSVFENQGLGLFGAWSTIVGNLDFYDLVAADFDGDQDDDLAVVATDIVVVAGASVYLSDGLGGWSSPSFWNIPAKGPEQIVATDLDCDGDLDLALGFVPSGTGGFVTLENDGSGAFPVAQRHGRGLFLAAMVSGDFDHDGAPDLAMAARDSNQWIVSLNKTCGLEIARAGVCNGLNNFIFSGATPGGMVFVALAQNRGQFVIPSGKPCAGTMMGLDVVGLRLAAALVADSNGIIQVSHFGGMPVCGQWMQIVDASTCRVSNLSQLHL